MNDLQKIEFQKSLQKIKDRKQLDYFKRELIKVLEASEDKVSKAIEDYDKSIAKTFREEFGIEKSRGYGIGTIREWKGRKYKKIAPNKWRLVYENNSRGAKQSIAYLKKAVMAAKSTDELLEIVMQNINRFQDANGKTLDIVSELQQAVRESKAKLNAGKPSTQEQIEKIKAGNKSTRPYTEVAAKDLKAGQKFNSPGGGTYTILSIEKDGNEYVVQIGKNNAIKIRENRTIQVINPDYETEYTKHLNEVKKEAKTIYESDIEIHEKLEKLKDLKYKEASREREELEKIRDKKNSNFKEWVEDRDFATNSYYELIDYLNPFINDVYANTPEQIEARRKKQEEKEAKEKALKDKIDEINSSVKAYTDEEINKAFNELEKIQTEFDINRNEFYQLKTQQKEYEERRVAYIKKYTGTYIHDDPEFKELVKKERDLESRKDETWQKLKEFGNKMEPYLAPMAYYYLNKFDYEKDARVDNCKTTQEVVNLIKTKDWYSEKGSDALELNRVDVNAAKDLFKCMERMFAIFPDQKGSDVSFSTKNSNSNTWAEGSHWSGVILNSRYYKDYAELKKDYENSEGGFHPKGTDVRDIIYHEYYHVMTTLGDLANTIYKTVTSRLKMKGQKGGPKQTELIAAGISGYATKNADEFGAESFCQAMGSDNPSGFAIEVFKEILKYKKYMRGVV
jgi:hypothetical protein